ncbi:hypothetical protein DUNSADRAFT_1508 [Dunaliella salina]|uniref:phosphoglycerate mutase (2,3-diphosphoglycerate-dependent) n=1 Tax=Dunaliella salina TaxID=3046 RepID=A0ABQ7GWY6_DUNSA|nr:hypothetical protein DUNSADRAFT_1508 [Dunaliella salina]|eukprot:KAF5839110.1 hypothetical protein DUNSADRAFT_1508 [Dunaliella salina]
MFRPRLLKAFLEGLDKEQVAKQYGSEQVQVWRRSFATRPPMLEQNDPRHPRYDGRYVPPPVIAELSPAQRHESSLDYPSPAELPATESLEDCVERTLPFWHSTIAPAVKRGERVLVCAHGNSLRGIVKHLDNISDEDIVGVEIPVGTPLIYNLMLTEGGELKAEGHYYLGEPQAISPPGTAGAGTGDLCQPATFGLLLASSDISSGVITSKDAVAGDAAVSDATTLGVMRGPPSQVCSASGVCGWLRDLQRVGLVSKPTGSVSGIIQVSPSRRFFPTVTSIPTTSFPSSIDDRPAANTSQDQQTFASSAAMPASVGPPLETAEATMEVPEIDTASAEAVARNKVNVGPILPLPLESSVYVDSVAAVLQHTSFILVDATPTPPGKPTQQPEPVAPRGTCSAQSPGLPESREALISSILPSLSPSQHTLLAMIQAQPARALHLRQMQQAREALACEGVGGPLDAARGSDKGLQVQQASQEGWGGSEGGHEELQGVEEILRAVGPACKVIAIRMPPPPISQCSPSAGVVAEPAGDEQIFPAAVAAPTGRELQQGGQRSGESWQVMAFGK